MGRLTATHSIDFDKMAELGDGHIVTTTHRRFNLSGTFWAGADMYRRTVAFDNGVMHQFYVTGSTGHYTDTHSTFVTRISGHFLLIVFC